MKKFAVLVSGTGSILEAMIENGLPISFVLADRECNGIEIAKQSGIETLVISRTFSPEFDREAYTNKVIEVLKAREIELVVMAGYNTILHEIMFDPTNYKQKVTNIHPSLLPSFKGHYAVRDALAFGVKVTGTTIHYATPQMDEGEIIAQETVKILPGQNEEDLHETIKQVERILYPKTVWKLIR